MTSYANTFVLPRDLACPVAPHISRDEVDGPAAHVRVAYDRYTSFYHRLSATIREVARAVYDELVGMEESLCRTRGSDQGITPVAERFPGGSREVEPLVLEACASAKADDRPYLLTVSPLGRELFRSD